MIRITDKDFLKLVDFLKKHVMDGAVLAFKEQGTKLSISTVDKSNKEVIIELSDEQYRMMPTVTRTETI